MFNMWEHTFKSEWRVQKSRIKDLIYYLQVRRYLPVANLTRTRQAVILEPLRPERFFVRTFNATSLYILSVCEVCGSYQCPYCPTFNRAALTLPCTMGMFAVLLSWTMICNFCLFSLRIKIVKGVLPDQT